MKIMVITGGIATGKSTFLTLLQKHSYHTLNCDKICAQVFQNCQAKILKALGPSIIHEGIIDRSRVRSLIFSNVDARRKLECIIHPRLYLRLFFEIVKCFLMNNDVVFIEVPLFFECKLDRFFDAILIYCSKNVQVERIIMRDGMNNVSNIISSQMCIEKKKELCKYVVYNEDNIENLEDYVKNMKFKGNKMSVYVLILMVIIFMWKFAV